MITIIIFSITFLVLFIFLLAYIFNVANILWGTVLKKEDPFVPLSRSVLSRVADEMVITKGNVVYDLGCGDGRVLFFLSKKYPEGRYVGVEKNILPFIIAKIIFFLHGRPKNIKIIKSDMFSCDLREASHIFTYLFPEHMEKIYEKLEKELKKGTRLVSCEFRFKKKNAKKTIRFKKGITRKNIYVYEF